MRVKEDPLSGVAGVCCPDWAGCLSSVCWPADWAECLARDASSARCIRWPESPKDGIRFGLRVRELDWALYHSKDRGRPQTHPIIYWNSWIQTVILFVWWGTLNLQESSTTRNIHYTHIYTTNYIQSCNTHKMRTVEEYWLCKLLQWHKDGNHIVRNFRLRLRHNRKSSEKNKKNTAALQTHHFHHQWR